MGLSKDEGISSIVVFENETAKALSFAAFGKSPFLVSFSLFSMLRLVLSEPKSRKGRKL